MHRHSCSTHVHTYNSHMRVFKVKELNMDDPTDIDRRDTQNTTVSESLINRELLTAAELRARAETIPQLLNTADAVAS